jgi:hypothetical protein
MLNKKEREEKIKRKFEREEREEFLQIEEKKIGLLEKLTILVEKQLVEKAENVIDKTKFTFNNTSQIFETKGYPYNTFIVSSTNKDLLVEVEYELERFQITLSEGFNRLNLPDGCLLRTGTFASNGTTVSLIRSKDKF